MAVNYTNLFENLGEFVQRVNDFVGLYSALDTDYSEIEAELQGNSMDDVLSGQYQQFQSFKGNILGWIQTIKGKTTELLVHRTTILEQLSLGGKTDLTSVLRELYNDMDGSQSVDGNTVTVGSVTEAKTNSDAAVLLVGKVLDGYNQPHPGFPSCVSYNEVDSELAGTTDDLVVTCVADSKTDRLAVGSERFAIGGKPAIPDPFHWETYGSGSGPEITPIHGYSLMNNLGFDSFVSNVPTNWTLDSGTAGTHVLEEATTIYQGTKSLELAGDAAQASIQISQAISLSRFNPLRRYLVAAYVQGNASLTQGTLTIQFEGTGYTAASGEKIEMNQAALAAQTSYGLEYFYINMPAEIPSDMKLVVKFTGTPSAHNIFVDYMAVGPVVYFDGVHFALVSGSELSLRGDRYTLTVSNDGAGTFQNYFRKAYGFQLPSDLSASETIADSLAE